MYLDPEDLAFIPDADPEYMAAAAVRQLERFQKKLRQFDNLVWDRGGYGHGPKGGRKMKEANRGRKP